LIFAKSLGWLGWENNMTRKTDGSTMAGGSKCILLFNNSDRGPLSPHTYTYIN